jgi:hypothetical protein
VPRFAVGADRRGSFTSSETGIWATLPPRVERALERVQTGTGFVAQRPKIDQVDRVGMASDVDKTKPLDSNASLRVGAANGPAAWARAATRHGGGYRCNQKPLAQKSS